MPFSDAIQRMVIERAKSRCVLCKKVGAEVDHIIPETDGGADTIDNAVPLCASCRDDRKRYQNGWFLDSLREKRDQWWKRCETADAIHPLGLALSGGGFRATAFHLGVLKRLKELKLLHQVDAISTVSGGSIAGAYWVYWQATKGDTLADPDEWNRFESALIALMRRGLRGGVLWRGFWMPAILLSAAVLVLISLNPGLPSSIWVVSLAAVVAGAYTFWHYRGSSLLEKEYRRRLFGDSGVNSLKYPPDHEAVNSRWPRLMINCAVLNTGHAAVFTNDHPAPGPESWMIKTKMGLNIRESLRVQKLASGMAPVPMPTETALATAVATSSCFPGAFAPLPLKAPEYAVHRLGGHWYRRARKDYLLRLVDGGVVDNQGTYALLDAKYRAIIISDASAALSTQHNPSTWQTFPIGRGVIFRTQEIIYEQVRNVGRKRLAERLARLEVKTARSGALDPVPKGYCYLELDPKGVQEKWDETGTKPIPRLSEFLTPFVKRIRTDLDKFSHTEISALMFHGYSLTEHLLSSRDLEDWVPIDAEPFRFHSADANLKIDWATISPSRTCSYGDKEFPLQLDIARHLQASDSRIAVWRYVRRFCNRWRWVGFFEAEAMGLRGQPRPVSRDSQREESQ